MPVPQQHWYLCAHSEGMVRAGACLFLASQAASQGSQTSWVTWEDPLPGDPQAS